MVWFAGWTNNTLAASRRLLSLLSFRVCGVETRVRHGVSVFLRVQLRNSTVAFLPGSSLVGRRRREGICFMPYHRRNSLSGIVNFLLLWHCRNINEN